MNRATSTLARMRAYEAGCRSNGVSAVAAVAEWGNWDELKVDIHPTGWIWNGRDWLDCADIEAFLAWDAATYGSTTS